MGKKIGILGSGAVGQVLANGLKDLGYLIEIGSRKGGKIANWDGATGTFKQVADNADLIILAVKGSAAEKVVVSIKDSLSGKTIIDTTNPIADQQAQDGVLSFFTSVNDSLMERLQSLVPKVNFVKAFNSVGSANMIKPNYADGIPTMFICGNNKQSKHEVTDILTKLKWEVEDMGKATSARAIEPLCILWCIPGLLHNQWSHAFKLLKN